MHLDKKQIIKTFVVLGLLVGPHLLWAATTGGAGGTEFKSIYDFIHGAATGYLGRSISIVGGLVGLGAGAAMGKMLPATVGVGLAAFGTLGPTVVDTIFTTATI